MRGWWGKEMAPIENYLLNLILNVLLAGGGATIVSYQIFKALGSSWLENKFAEKLEAFRHEKAKEIEKLRGDIDGSLRAKVRHQDKEFLVISECWHLLNVAYGATFSSASSLQQYEDISRMSSELRREFVSKLDILDSQKNEILTDDNPREAYVRTMGLIRYNAANRATVEFNNCVFRGEIFLDDEISEDFKEIIKLLQSIVISKSLALEEKDFKLGSEAWDKLQNQCHPKIADLTKKLRGRIGRHVADS